MARLPVSSVTSGLQSPRLIGLEQGGQESRNSHCSTERTKGIEHEGWQVGSLENRRTVFKAKVYLQDSSGRCVSPLMQRLPRSCGFMFFF